jgi:hypothetical protein
VNAEGYIRASNVIARSETTKQTQTLRRRVIVLSKLGRYV